ncbi:site-specific integrase [Sulfurimonas sp. HSL-3221]|uniref:tyrosine-type recombinase/integrase n=1 Tax=Sulfurimonadaceae TaxID=2771471 RepID=UPI001E5C3967|nr:tyrosine-type recombinase/integrase [Sulfurimonas sp. HSL-3221]UFS61817.1 site-specific integrase [Sulfurimonas sp. HSL-3221]
MKLYVKKTKTKNGVRESLWVDFSHGGKRYRKPLKLDNTPENRKLAKTKIIPQLMLKLHSGEFFEKRIPTLNDFSVTSFEMHSNSRRAVTQTEYANAYRLHIALVLGKKKIDTIKPSDIQRWQNNLLKTLSPRRVRHIRAVLSGILKDAMKDELIEKSPLALVSTPKLNKTDINPFSVEEINLILNGSSGQFRNFYALAFFTGMRSGEMIGLRWEDVDFLRGSISVKRAIKMGTVTEPKTAQSIRQVEMIDTLIPYLQDQFKQTGQNDSYVFLNRDGEHYYDIKRIRDTDWKRTLKKCRLEYRPIYHTRHSFATMMLEHNEDILWVSNMLGHKDATMTLSHYARYINRKRKKRASFLEKSVALNDTVMAPRISKSA